MNFCSNHTFHSCFDIGFTFRYQRRTCAVISRSGSIVSCVFLGPDLLPVGDTFYLDLNNLEYRFT